MEQSKRRSSFVDPATRPDLHAQAPFARSRLSVANPLVSSPLSMTSVLPGIPPSVSGVSVKQGGQPGAVTTREAVVGEVIAEEYNATENRIREEEGNQPNDPPTRSWLTSWMFSRMPWSS